jgi:hypothetical protein
LRKLCTPAIRPSATSRTAIAKGAWPPPSLRRRAPAADARPEHPALDLARPDEPHRVGRHRERRVVVQQRDQLGDVVALERVDVAREQVLLVALDDRGAAGVELQPVERGACALQRAVDRGHGRVEQLGDLAGLPAQDLAQDEHRALAGRQVLQRRDERQPDRLARCGDLRRIAIGQHAGVGHGLQPRLLGQDARQRRVGRRRRGQVHRSRAALGALQHVEGDVRRDPVQPGAQRRRGLEPVGRTPRADHRLLHGVLGLERRAEHAIAVARQLAAVRLEIELDRAGRAAGIAGNRVGAGGHGAIVRGSARPIVDGPMN